MKPILVTVIFCVVTTFCSVSTAHAAAMSMVDYCCYVTGGYYVYSQKNELCSHATFASYYEFRSCMGFAK